MIVRGCFTVSIVPRTRKNLKYRQIIIARFHMNIRVDTAQAEIDLKMMTKSHILCLITKNLQKDQIKICLWSKAARKKLDDD